MPTLIIHADWGSAPRKRYMARAMLENDRYIAHAPEPVGHSETLFERMHKVVGEDDTILIGFDFPIGLPAAYAERVGTHDFLDLLPTLGRGEWSDFYKVAEEPADIGLHRPFYPQRPGGARMHHLLDALDMNSTDDLLRRCDWASAERRAASPLFWTLGAQQVGKAAIKGWTQVLTPALTSEVSGVAVWPFDGTLCNLLTPGRIVIAETYPAEFYRHLSIALNPSKRSQVARRSCAETLLQWANEAQVKLSSTLQAALDDGFGLSPAGEDPCDAIVGLFGMHHVVLGYKATGEPDDEQTRKIEGWMLGKTTQHENSNAQQGT